MPEGDLNGLVSSQGSSTVDGAVLRDAGTVISVSFAFGCTIGSFDALQKGTGSG